MRRLLFPIIVLVTMSGCDGVPYLGGTYAAEVGYYEGGGQKWEIYGDYKTLDACREEAISRFNAHNSRSPGRAFSWACLKKNNDGGYESRHR